MDIVCKECGLFQYSNNPKIAGRGVKNPKLILIGEAPGPDEAKQGQVFIGRAGKKLQQMLIPYMYLGIYITNIVKCFPPISTTNPLKGFRVPSVKEIECCRKFFYQELDEIGENPVLMPLGNTSLFGIIGCTGITKYVGKIIKHELNNKEYTIIPNYHPSYICRNPKMESEFIKVMEICKDCLC